MGFWWNVLRVAVAAVTVVAVGEISGRFPRLGALLLSLPVISILAFTFSWAQHRNLAAVSQMARETLVLVPLGLVFLCRWRLPNVYIGAFGRHLPWALPWLPL